MKDNKDKTTAMPSQVQPVVLPDCYVGTNIPPQLVRSDALLCPKCRELVDEMSNAMVPIADCIREGTTETMGFCLLVENLQEILIQHNVELSCEASKPTKIKEQYK